MSPTRRDIVIAGIGLAVTLRLQAADGTTGDLATAIKAHTGGAPLRDGRVKFEIDTLVENGNAVPLVVNVDSPMTPADHVKAIAVFNERNPQREVINVVLGPRSGRARIGTRVRLATSQRLVAIAQMNDGSFWSGGVDVIVTLAGCVES
jgi:sulfur-oxidizing protein SoxY